MIKHLNYYFYKYYYYVILFLSVIFKPNDYNKIRLDAFRKHNSVRQRYAGKYPYFYHLNMVGKMVRKFYLQCGFSDIDFIDLYKMAMLHDFIEDLHMYTYNDLKKEYGLRVAEAVYACTELRGKNRSERHGDEYIQYLMSNTDGHFIKLCDICANMTFGFRTKNSMFMKYLKELPANEKKLKNGKDDIIFTYMNYTFNSPK